MGNSQGSRDLIPCSPPTRSRRSGHEALSYEQPIRQEQAVRLICTGPDLFLILRNQTYRRKTEARTAPILGSPLALLLEHIIRCLFPILSSLPVLKASYISKMTAATLVLGMMNTGPLSSPVVTFPYRTSLTDPV